MSLREYQKKRDFQKTAEPAPRMPKSESGQRFIVQKHDASRVHYDFRLEMAGVLKSWAVPKGFPWIQSERHLAVQVEDHPLEYANFEGIIPQGQYGGGTVMLWDQGTYEVYGATPLQALQEGKLHLRLTGEKLKGEWTLVRTKSDLEKKQWLLLKTGENAKPISAKRDNQSILTKRTMAQIAAQRTATWQSAPEEQGPPKKSAPAPSPAKPKRTSRNAKPRFLEPMKARLVEEPPAVGDWVYELKWDGFRTLAVKDGDSVELYSRNEKSLSTAFPEICAAVRALAADRLVLDGEIVALDKKGRSSFQLLQAHRSGRERPAIYYYVFDLLHLDGRDLLKMRLCERKTLLETSLQGSGDALRYSAGLEADVADMLREIRARGMEGVIGKCRDSQYHPGARNGDWVKIKCVNEQEFAVGGFTQPKGARQQLGALHVGYYDGKEFRYAGKVGTGFNVPMLRELRKRLEPLRQEESPFTDIPEKVEGVWSRNMSPAAMRAAEWVKPALVCQVKFTEWTQDGALRHPVFLGVREDKNARDVVRERPPVS